MARVERVRIFCDSLGCIEDIDSPTVAPGPYTMFRCQTVPLRGVAVSDGGSKPLAVFLDGPDNQAGSNAEAWIAGVAALEKLDALKKLLNSALDDRVTLSIVRRTVLDET